MYFCLRHYGKVNINLFTVYNWEGTILKTTGNYFSSETVETIYMSI